MKKTIIYLSIIIAMVSTCFVTSVSANVAAPTITGIHGGYGVTATVTYAKGRDWSITISGQHVLFGMKTSGTISSETETIRTTMFPPAFGFGKIFIKVTVDRIILPDITEEKTAYMIGPFVLFVQDLPSC